MTGFSKIAISRLKLTHPLLLRSAPLISLLFFASLTVACSLPFIGGDDSTPVPTPPPDEILTYVTPLYRATLDPGQSIAGTQMTYVDREDDVYNVTIDGLPAAKRIGDSFIWKGLIAPGVVARYNLRMSPTFLSDSLLVIGPVELSVLNPIPVELDSLPPESDNRIHFSEIAVDLSAAKGAGIPGTSLVYEGLSDEGAQLSGTKGYPYRAQGDSLIWIGRLRGNVMIRYSLRMANINEEQIRLLGTAELWIDLNQ